MHNLAVQYSEVCRQQEALELMEKVVTANKRTLGEEYPDYFRSMRSLAICYSEVGRQQEALQLMGKVVAASKRTLGDEHPDTLLSQGNLTILRQAPSMSAA
jgi:Tetratricopeptide repeat